MQQEFLKPQTSKLQILKHVRQKYPSGQLAGRTSSAGCWRHRAAKILANENSRPAMACTGSAGVPADELTCSMANSASNIGSSFHVANAGAVLLATLLSLGHPWETDFSHEDPMIPGAYYESTNWTRCFKLLTWPRWEQPILTSTLSRYLYMFFFVAEHVSGCFTFLS